MMRDFNVLLTCCSMHVKERIDSLKENEDGVNVGVYAVNSVEANLPPDGMTDGQYVVPPIFDKDYISTVLDICKRHSIDVIVPTATIELGLMARNKGFFEREGVKVSVSSPESIDVANDKIELHKRYGSLMPRQVIPNTLEDVQEFHESLPKGSRICCKLSNHAGGNGFAIVDRKKALDITLFNKFGENRYIAFKDLAEILERRTENVIIQEYADGHDYTVSLLAVNGEVTHIVGYIGYQMSFGAIVSGEIMFNERAYDIATQITKELRLDGNACFDFRIKENGEVVLLEVNPRVNASLPFVWKAGINMLYLRCKNLLGDYSNINENHRIQFGLKMRKYYDTTYFV